jgi:hypothetical protein
MISVWDVQNVYNKLRSRKWKVVNEDYAQIKVSQYGMQLVGRDGSVLSAGLANKDQLHVWVTDANGRAIIRILVDESVAINTEFHCGYHTAADLCEALLYAQHNVVYDEVEGYLWDRPPLGRELVVEFGEQEDPYAVCN